MHVFADERFSLEEAIDYNVAKHEKYTKIVD